MSLYSTLASRMTQGLTLLAATVLTTLPAYAGRTDSHPANAAGSTPANHIVAFRPRQADQHVANQTGSPTYAPFQATPVEHADQMNAHAGPGIRPYHSAADLVEIRVILGEPVAMSNHLALVRTDSALAVYTDSD